MSDTCLILYLIWGGWMLRIIRSMSALDIAQIMTVYKESNRSNGRENYPHLSENLQLLQAEQDFYAYLGEFLSDEGSFYAVWAPEGCYTAALRLERYCDGLLLTALETAPEARRRGNASALVQAVLVYLAEHGRTKVYSHVSKGNPASIAVHTSCGFEKIHEYAVYIDGSVFHNCCTFCYSI